MQSDTARMIGTLGVWIAVAVTLALGVFRTNWNEAFWCVLVVAVICVAATASTAAIWTSGRRNDTPGR